VAGFDRKRQSRFRRYFGGGAEVFSSACRIPAKGPIELLGVAGRRCSRLALRRGDDLVGDPAGDAVGVGGPEAEDDVGEAGADGGTDGVPGGSQVGVGNPKGETTG
jgi:hypothetical protein